MVWISPLDLIIDRTPPGSSIYPAEATCLSAASSNPAPHTYTQEKEGQTHRPHGPGSGSRTGPWPVTDFSPGHKEAGSILRRITGHLSGSPTPAMASQALTASGAPSGSGGHGTHSISWGRAVASSRPLTWLPAPPSSLYLTIDGPLLPCKRLH